MAQLKREYTANDVVEPRADFSLIPSGTVVEAVLAESEMKPTKAGNGHYLACVFQVIDGPFENRKLFVNLNLDNPSEAAVKIAEAELFQIREACGKPRVSDSEELHGIPVLLTVGIEPARGDFEARNKIKKYSAVPKPAATTSTSGTKASAPWGNKT